jgi:hypothetical protein
LVDFGGVALSVKTVTDMCCNTRRRHVCVSAHCTARYRHVCTGWRRLTGCLKLQVIFRKGATNHRALLRKITDRDKAAYDSTPPCTHTRMHTHNSSDRKTSTAYPIWSDIFESSFRSS